jgi:hypothetical protein
MNKIIREKGVINIRINEKCFVQKSFKEEAEELVELLFRGGLDLSIC